MNRFRTILLSLVAIGLWCPVAPGDVVITTDGGKIDGEIMPDLETTGEIVVKTRLGMVRLDRDQVREVILAKTQEENYEKKRRETDATADGEFELALWCLKQGMSAEYRLHLERVIEIDPNHADARHRLGFTLRGEKWLTDDEIREADGYVRYRGRWVLPQERDAADAKREASSRRAELGRLIKSAQRGLRADNKPDRQLEAADELLAIDDPLAVPLLMRTLGEKGTPYERKILAETLANIEGDESTDALVQYVLSEPELSNRQLAIESLVPRKSVPVTGRFVKGLRSSENVHVRRSAEALTVLGDTSVLAALVDALITKHQYVYNPTVEEIGRSMGRNSYKTAETVTLPDGTIIRRNLVNPYNTRQPITTSRPQPQVIVKEIRNEEVLAALEQLTDESFGYDQDAWRDWLRAEYRDAVRQPADPP